MFLSCSFVHLQCESKNPPLKFSDIFFTKVWEFLVQILHAYYIFLSTLDYKFLIQLSATLTKLCHIKRDHHNVLKMSTIECAPNVRHRPKRTLGGPT